MFLRTFYSFVLLSHNPLPPFYALLYFDYAALAIHSIKLMMMLAARVLNGFESGTGIAEMACPHSPVVAKQATGYISPGVTWICRCGRVAVRERCTDDVHCSALAQHQQIALINYQRTKFDRRRRAETSAIYEERQH